ncbi:MAG TPA: MFS transporter, partial [Telmatospirillum sp.]|nr:MFS transporter [Telmatospirillum sp.]
MKKKSVIEAVIFLTYALFAFSWVAGSMLSKEITRDFGVEGVTAATWSTNAITIAKVIGNLIAAWFLIRLKPKKAFAFASFLIVAGVFGVWSGSYPVYVFSRLIMGFGGAFVIVYFGPIVMTYFTPEERPLVNGINSIAFNTGNLLSLLFTGSLFAALGSWRSVIVVIASASLVLLVAWLIVSEDFSLEGKVQRGDPSAKPYGLSDGVKEPFNWILPLCYSGILFAYIAVFALFPHIPTFAVPARYLSALMISSGMMGTVAGIVAAKKYPLRVPLIRYSGLIMTAFIALMILTSHQYLAYLSAFLAGFFMFLPVTAMMTLPQELPGMTPGHVTVVFGMFWSIAYVVETICMYCASVLVDMTGDPFKAALFVLVCSSSAFLASFFLPETG